MSKMRDTVTVRFQRIPLPDSQPMSSAGHATDCKTHSSLRRRVRRLLLYPNSGQVYGFTMNSPAGDFIFRSRSCSEEGNVAKSGVYKMSEHLLPNRRRVNNLDLLFVDGTIALLHLTPAGAGFKVFPRRVPGFEASFE